MKKERCLSEREMQILSKLSVRRCYGAELLVMTGQPSGVLYPILKRLQRQGFLSSRVERASPQHLGRPRRRTYEATTDGIKRFALALSRVVA